MKKIWSVALAAVALTAAAPAGAQVFTPTFMDHRLTSDIGVYVNDGPGDLSIEGIWRRGALGLRAGYADLADDGALLLGIEWKNPLTLGGTAPLGLAFTLGAQGAIGEVDAFGGQAGLSAGYSFPGPSFTLTPYIHPRIALINGFGENDDTEVDVLADIGLTFDFSAASLRFAANLGDGADWGIGLAFRQ